MPQPANTTANTYGSTHAYLIIYRLRRKHSLCTDQRHNFLDYSKPSAKKQDGAKFNPVRGFHDPNGAFGTNGLPLLPSAQCRELTLALE
jgi:hypothetical protein